MAILYGDTSGSLLGLQVGGDQILIGDSGGSGQQVTNRLYGDAYFIGGFAHGGNDTLIGGSADFLGEQIYGDAYTMNDFTVGGDDQITGARGTGTIYGDAVTLSGFARGGNDDILVSSGSAGTGCPRRAIHGWLPVLWQPSHLA